MASSIRTQFEIPGKMKTWSLSLIGIGLVALVIGLATKGLSSDEHEQAHFWGTLMYNTIFWTMICNASMFFICATTLAMGGWEQTFRRVCEAISTMVPIFGSITFVVLLYVVLGNKHHIYHWLDSDAVANDSLLKGKSGFLNPKFFIIWTTLTLGFWSLLGWRMRQLGNEADEPMDAEQGASFIWRGTIRAALFIVWFALTVGSTVPWLWMMSIDAHWYSTMYSWYTFASSFVSGMSLIALWVIYLKNKGYLELTNQEHLQDLGKFMFAFSIFWTYLWFAQYMLIWYANIPEETVYFKHRVQGPYKGIFFLNLIINFVCPILILMKRSAKRNYTLMTFMAVLILFGHWIDFYQMVMGSLSKEHVTLGWLDFGILSLFVGMMIYFVGKSLASKPLVQKHHPFIKESVIHVV
ncbi:quinol:cytochrome c oxidoreductase quinone-binding subunit 2 [Hydrobacter penzbergensis]|uniref:Quinol:cytochrome c oxidoreductase quinone-binding subunit 2 n=1 Tax=Hydrobacter penzbergensis TaxID=1235997 RepID=A0A8X8LB53_9BACT|nr:quinol:cytochrome C oxidoreductase [Hydrobacter penzbergensis]SDW76098.1 quinol:cytochrome c oxidoreductase quinone-binding subunit 2 [Hydrobacter penzbergensis]